MSSDIKKRPDEQGQCVQAKELVTPSQAGENGTLQEPHHDIQTTATTRSTPESMAGAAHRRGECAGGVSPAGVALHAKFDGAGERTCESAAAGALAESIQVEA